MSAATTALFILFVTASLAKPASSIKVSINSTEPHDEASKESRSELPGLADGDQLFEIRERVRRLIPYMTYYMVNNYVAAQQRRQPAPESPILARRPIQVPVNLQEDRFIPSVQYNAKGLNQELDYFVPVRYDDYLIGLTTSRPVPPPITIPETRYQTTTRPVSFLPSKPKPVSPKPPRDYLRTSQAAAPEEFESVRFASKPRPPPSRYVHQQQPEPVLQHPTPRVSLNHILKSLQLTNQLPEVLNHDNIDSSINTLMEILHILNMGYKDSKVQVEKYKPIHTQPKVITESNYEATKISVTPHNELMEINPVLKPNVNPVKNQMPPSQLVKIKPVRPFIEPIKAQAPTPTSQTNNKIIEYYVPIVQDVDDEKTPQMPQIHSSTYNPANKHPVIAQNTESSSVNVYDPDQHDKILEDERYTLPVPAKKPNQSFQPKPSSKLHSSSSSSQFKYGVTRGKPHIDYPAYTEIPETNFSCKQQRYKGFFGDPETGCQVWHYCDLNGGKSSFLCPNGTIFSQVALTCDWWFNVKCESTTQLYVLNERLYKYILPIMPKFPEDFSGPEVDKYLELKFKEMEAKIKEKKAKKEEQEEDRNTVNTLQSIEDSK